MSKLTDLAAAVGRTLAPLSYAVTAEVTDNTDTVAAVSPAGPREGARVDYITLIRRLSQVMASAPDGHYLRVTVPDVNDWQFAVLPGGAVLTGEGPTYHAEAIDLSAEVPRLVMRRIMPGQWCAETTVGVLYYGGGTFDFVGEDRVMWSDSHPLWVSSDLPESSGLPIDGLGPRTTGVVYGIFAA